MPLLGLIVFQPAAPSSEQACDWLSVNASNVLISLLIWVLLLWLAAMWVCSLRNETNCRASVYRSRSVKSKLAHSDFFSNLRPHCRLIPRFATPRQRLAGTQLAWLWWTRWWTSCRADGSALSSSVRVCSRLPQIVQWVGASADTQLLHLVPCQTAGWHRGRMLNLEY